MVCIYCQHSTSIVNSRHQVRINQTWRRRHCSNCGAVFTTLETADYSGVWRVATTNQALQPFQRQKLFISIFRSLEHRSTAIVDAEALTNTVMATLQATTASGQLSPRQIVTAVQAVLARFDTAAAIHYQAFHPLGF